MTGINSRRTVGIIDYQAGNIHSISSAFEHIGADVKLVTSGADMDACSHLVLPGVGAFGFCARRLNASGIIPALHRWVFELERPLLGICVGMQLLGDGSEESPDEDGLGWIGGRIAKLQAKATVTVPHVGWNSVRFLSDYGEFTQGEQTDFYFDHSFAYLEPVHGSVVGECLHGTRFSAALQRDNITAAQFHPEKSQAAGLRFLEGFLQR